MQIDRIGFGYVKNLGGYENCKLYIEAKIESWEDPAQSLELLRNRVAEELDLPDGWRDLRCKYNQEVAALRNIENSLHDSKQKLAEAQKAWGEYQNFLVAHGVDPKTLTLDRPYLSRAITAHKLDTSLQDLLPLNEGAVEDDDDYINPYGEEDDYIDPNSEEYDQLYESASRQYPDF